MIVPAWIVAMGICWNAGSLLWTWRVERKFHRICAELKIQRAGIKGVRGNIARVEEYLEKTPTSHFPIAFDLRKERLPQ